mmetsp:Transcript_13804/g.44145  ORF Transcript_13804/g.44145 Transcript_13804/m.44145 type:complete len:215 (-) Transcript_13804:929-1573(-)
MGHAENGSSPTRSLPHTGKGKPATTSSCRSNPAGPAATDWPVPLAIGLAFFLSKLVLEPTVLQERQAAARAIATHRRAGRTRESKMKTFWNFAYLYEYSGVGLVVGARSRRGRRFAARGFLFMRVYNGSHRSPRWSMSVLSSQRMACGLQRPTKASAAQSLRARTIYKGPEHLGAKERSEPCSLTGRRAAGRLRAHSSAAFRSFFFFIEREGVG